jgi:hypothetical protein
MTEFFFLTGPVSRSLPSAARLTRLRFHPHVSCRGRGAIISCGLHPLPCLRLTLNNTQRGSSAESTDEISDLNREFEISVLRVTVLVRTDHAQHTRHLTPP